jgi:transcriptional regulator with XRE-family HTH domain
VNREQLADFLRTRREALQPQDVGLPRGARRRTSGLRREEVALLAGMSTDYLSRLEQQRGPQPSLPMLASIARALHLSLDERDHLFRLAGHNAPARSLHSTHITPGLLRVMDRLQDTPAQIMGGLGETLLQNRLAIALLGVETEFTGMSRSVGYRWFTDPDARCIYPEEEHAGQSRIVVSELRIAATREPNNPQLVPMIERLLETSAEFAALWARHLVDGHPDRRKRIRHPELGVLELDCQRLFDADQSQTLLVFTATPGTESYDKLELLSVIGVDSMTA